MTRKLWLIAPWAIFVILVIAWLFYWFAVAGAAEQRLEQWRDAQRAAGGNVAYSAVQRRGFPVLMRLEVSDMHYRPPHVHWSVSTVRLDLHVNLVNPSHVALESRAPVLIRHADGSINTIVARKLIASLRTSNGALAQAGVEADALTMSSSTKPGELRVGKLVANVRPDPRAPDQYQIAFTGTALTLARPVRSFETFGQDISNLEAGIVIERGAALFEPSPEDPLQPWREGGGKARFEYLRLNWGPLNANGTGEAALDAERRLAGKLRLEIERPGPAVAALARSEDVSDDARQALLALALGLTLSSRTVSFEVEAQDGALRVENARVRTLEPLY